MATYLDGYEHHVFVSFAAFDDKAPGDAEGWATRFSGRLADALWQQLGRQVQVTWRGKDDKADVRRSAVLVVLISSAYGRMVKDRDLQAFAGGAGRLVPVLMQNVPSEEWPTACRNIRAEGFCDISDTEYGHRLDIDSEGFIEALRSLSERVATILKTLERPPEPEKGNGVFTVFLATTSDDLARDARRLSKELLREGVAVVSNIPPPRPLDEHAAAIRDALAGADLAVHLLGPYPGGTVDDGGPRQTYPVEQLRLGREHAASQLVFLSETLDDVEPDEDDAWYRDLLDELATAERDEVRFELVRAGRHRLAEEVLAKKTVLEEARRKTAAASGPRTAFVDLHQNDLPQAAELLACLARNSFVPVAVPVLGLSPSEGLERFEENLERAQLFVLVFGAVARGWVEERLEAAIKLVASRRLSTRMAVCVPSTERRSDVPFRNFVDVMVSTDPASIELILRKLDKDKE